MPEHDANTSSGCAGNRFGMPIHADVQASTVSTRTQAASLLQQLFRSLT